MHVHVSQTKLYLPVIPVMQEFLLIDCSILQTCCDIGESLVLWKTLAVADGDNQPVEWLSIQPVDLDAIIPDFIEYRKKCNCDDLMKGNLCCKTLTHQSGSMTFCIACCGWRLELDKLDNRVVAVHYKSARVSPRMQLFHDVVSLRLVHAFSALYE